MDLIDIGTRYKLLFVVYGAGYYDSIKDFNKDTIFESDSTKGLVLQFYRGVSKETMISTFESNIQMRNINNSEEVNNELITLNNCFKNINNLNYKDIIHIIWENKTLYLYYNNNLIGEIEFQTFLLN